MNIYKLPVDAYNRTHEQTISEDVIKDKLVGQKWKRKEISDEDKRIEISDIHVIKKYCESKEET